MTTKKAQARKRVTKKSKQAEPVVLPNQVTPYDVYVAGALAGMIARSSGDVPLSALVAMSLHIATEVEEAVRA
jgi:hypothetical protein